MILTITVYIPVRMITRLLHSKNREQIPVCSLLFMFVAVMLSFLKFCFLEMSAWQTILQYRNTTTVITQLKRSDICN